MTEHGAEMQPRAGNFSEAPGQVAIRVIGGISVEIAGEPISIGGPRQRRLLALLAIRAGSVVSIDWLGEHLWADADRPDAVAPALRTYVSRLRQSFPPDEREWLQTEPSGYRLAAPEAALEHRWFSSLRARAKDARDAQDPQTALALLDQALGLWRGQPFRELEDLEWARAEIEQLELDRLEMLEERWEASLALGRHTQITGELAAFTAEHDLRERAVRQHALALHRSGRTTEALRVISDFRQRIADRSGLEPSSELVGLETAILQDDPSLAVDTVGRPLRGYRLLEEIGSGAFSIVWRGLQPSVDREVAIKQIRSDLATQPDFIRRFEAEAHLVARIEHPHIVPLIDYWRDPESAYLVMRWLRGGTLERRLDDGALSVEQTMTLARQVGGALATAHSHGIVHRDVKTANILFDEQANAYLTDFGIALEAAKSSGIEAALSPGSPAYASPEQIRREHLGPQADIFSLAVVLFECLTGSLPFASSTSIDELIRLQLQAPFPSLAELRADTAPSIADTIARATSKDPSDRFDSIESFLAALEGNTAPLATPSASVPDDIENPYKGLLAFDDGDESAFFGRDAFVAEMLGRLSGDSLSSRCLIIVGPSGSGKSSVVRAGLTPAIRSGDVPGSDSWFVSTMVPGLDAFESLEAALLRIAVNPPPSLLEQLRDGDRGILRSVRRCLPGDGSTALLIIDQFEELFTGPNPEDAHAFLGALATAVHDPQSPLRVVLTLRADYYHRPLEHPTFAPILKETALDLTPLAPHELEQAIVEPARRVGVQFESGLVARIAAETIGQPSPLPLLQYALSELFDRRSLDELTVQAFEEAGGLSGALASRAEAIHDMCSVEEQAAIRRVFGRLTSVSERTTDVRRRVEVSELGDHPATATVLDRFGAARLIAFDRDEYSREPTVDVAHEALLREWPRLRSWLEEDRDVLRSAEALASAASTWEQGGRTEADLYRAGRLETAAALAIAAPERLRPLDIEFIDSSKVAASKEQERERRSLVRLRRLVVGVGAALVLALVAGAFAFRAQQQADDRAAEADLASIISRSAAVSSEDPTLSALLALEANRRNDTPETQQAVLNALGSSTAATRVIAHEALATEECPGGLLAPDAFHEHGVVDGVLTTRDLNTGIATDHGAPAEPCVYWRGFEAQNARIQGRPDSQRIWFGTYDGVPVARDFDSPIVTVTPIAPGDNGVLPLVQTFEDATQLLLVDAQTGSNVVDPIPGAGHWHGGGIDITSDGSIAAFATGAAPGERAEGAGSTRVVDTTNGEILYEFNTPLPASRIAIDEARDEIVLAELDGRISTWSLATGANVATTAIVAGERIFDLKIRDDGTLAIATSGEVQWVDRNAGLVEIVAEIRDVLWASYRADDSIVLVTAEGRIEVLDLNASVLVESSFDTASDMSATYDRGQAALFGLEVAERQPLALLDLATGNRQPLDLRDRDGAAFVAGGLWPVANGVVAMQWDGLIGRWERGQQVDRLEFDRTPFNSISRLDDSMSIVLGNLDDNNREVVRIRLTDFDELSSIPVSNAWAAHPVPNGGLYVFDGDGVLYSFAADGSETNRFDTGLKHVQHMRFDPVSELIAVEGFGAWQGIAIVDPVNQTVTRTLEGSQFAGVGFAGNGTSLAIAGLDGTVRLWDIERNASAGLAWNGRGANRGAAPWYDATTDSLWVHTSGQLVQIPLDPERWVDKACDFVGRDLTEQEWERFVPGDGEVQSACDA